MKIDKMTYNEAKWWILNDWEFIENKASKYYNCLLYTSPSPRDQA